MTLSRAIRAKKDVNFFSLWGCTKSTKDSTILSRKWSVASRTRGKVSSSSNYIGAFPCVVARPVPAERPP